MSGQGQSSSNAGEGAANLLKQGWAKFHGAGDAIRGSVNSFADGATGTDDTRSNGVASSGMNEFRSGTPSKVDSTGATVEAPASNSRVGQAPASADGRLA